MHIQDFLDKLHNASHTLQFSDTMAVVDANYIFAPTAFCNGEYENAAGQNSGSCKLFAFAQAHGFNQAQTLACFGDYYRVDVLQHPNNTDHQNIRNFMVHGWQGIHFEGQPLAIKTNI